MCPNWCPERQVITMKAYDKSYLYDAMLNLADAFDYAVNEKKIKPDDFSAMFVVSGLAEQFGSGNPKYIAGMSGRETAERSIEAAVQTRKLMVGKPRPITIEKTPEYWAGWITAYWQWKTGRTFKDIFENIKLSKIIDMYHPYHEMDENRFVDDVEELISANNLHKPTKLAVIRNNCGLSQSELALNAEVNIRNIQQYEQRAKDISKAGIDTVMKLAKALNCSIEDIKI